MNRHRTVSLHNPTLAVIDVFVRDAPILLFAESIAIGAQMPTVVRRKAIIEELEHK